MEEVPCVGTLFEDLCIGVENGDGVFVCPPVLPDVFHLVEFGRVARQWQKSDVVRPMQPFRAMPPSSVPDQQSVRAGCEGFGDLGQVQGHGFCVGMWHDQPSSRATFGASRAKE